MINSPLFISPLNNFAAKFAFGPLDLNPELLLDASDVNALISDGTDNVAILDQSEDLAEVNVYTSDFSSGVDGYVGTRLTLTGSNNNISDGSTSKSNTLKAVCSGGNGTHLITLSSLLTVGKAYNENIFLYIPSGQTITGISIYNGIEFYDWLDIEGSWIEIDTKIVQGLGTSHSIYLRASNGSLNFDADLDVYYIASGQIINEIQGNHFTQVTAANRGLQDSETVPTKITYSAASSQFNENVIPSQVATFAAMSTSSIIYINDNIAITQFAVNNSSSNSISARFGAQSNKAYLLIYDVTNSISNTILSDNPISVDDVVEWRINANSYQCFINGIEVGTTTSSGSNNGAGFNQLTGIDNLSIGSLQRLTPFYDNLIFKHLFIRSTPLTDAESLQYANYLISKHNL